MDDSKKQICLQTVFTLVVLATGIAIGYTQFVQAELKSDISDVKDLVIELKKASDIQGEKITSVQIQIAKLGG